MKNRIETLEQLDQALNKIRVTGSLAGAKNDMERLAWHLLTGTPFDTSILLKGSELTTAEGSELTTAEGSGLTTTEGSELTTTEGSDTTASARETGNYIEAQNHRYGPDFTLDNKALCQWMTTTPLENIAAHTACIVRQQEFNKVSDYYDAAQDFYADNWHEWDDYKAGTMSGRQFVEALISHVEEINSHVAEGKKMGLTMEQIILHDSMWGLLPSRFDTELAEVAKVVLAKAEAEIADMRPYIWSEEGKRAFAPRMLDFADKQLQEIGIDIGLHKHYTTEQGYLLDYFSRMYWREAASHPEE